MPEVLRLEADGYARNLLDLKNSRPTLRSTADSIAPGWPTASVRDRERSCRHSPSRAAPECSAMHTTLTSGFSDAGDIAADGRVSPLGPETGSADIGLREFGCGPLPYPAPGIGRVSATIQPPAPDSILFRPCGD